MEITISQAQSMLQWYHRKSARIPQDDELATYLMLEILFQTDEESNDKAFKKSMDRSKNLHRPATLTKQHDEEDLYDEDEYEDDDDERFY